MLIPRRNVRKGQVSAFPATVYPSSLIPQPGSFHTIAYNATLGAGAQTDTDLAALTDNIIQIQNGHFLPPVDMNVLWASTFGASVTRAKLSSPKIRQINTAYIRPMNNSITPVNNQNVQVFPSGGFTVRGLEELAVLVSDSAGTVKQTVCVGLLANRVPVPAGDIFNFRCTGTTTAVVDTWTAVPLTFEVTPPVGTYAVIGAECIGTTVKAFRLIFDGMYFRPGFVGLNANTSRLLERTMNGLFGVWGYFRNVNLPRLEVLCNAADTAQELYLETVRVA